jgi:hypothetical protein
MDQQGLVQRTLAEIRTPEVVAIYVTDSASGRMNKFDVKIVDLEIPAPIKVSPEFYGYLRRHIDETAGAETFRKGNKFYTATDGTQVAEILSPEKVRVGGREEIIADLKPAPNIEVSREYYGYLRRHIATSAGAETYRRGNKFYTTTDDMLVAEIISTEKVRIYTQTRSGLFSKTTTKEIDIASLKPERIYIPHELLYITKKLFGSYRRFDRRVRMDSGNQSKSSNVSPLNAEAAKVFFGKSTTGLTEDEIKYLIMHWAGDMTNNRRARTNHASNAQPKRIIIPAPPHPAPMSLLIESAEIFIAKETLTVDERLEAMRRLGLDPLLLFRETQLSRRQQQQQQQTTQSRFYSSRHPSTVLGGHEIRKPQELERALRIEAAQTTPATSLELAMVSGAVP